MLYVVFVEVNNVGESSIVVSLILKSVVTHRSRREERKGIYGVRDHSKSASIDPRISRGRRSEARRLATIPQRV